MTMALLVYRMKKRNFSKKPKACLRINNLKMNPTKIPSTVYLFSTLLLLLISTIKTEASDLFPSALMKHETQWLMKVLEQAHFNKVSIDELNSTSFINRFVSKLDKQNYILQRQRLMNFI